MFFLIWRGRLNIASINENLFMRIDIVNFTNLFSLFEENILGPLNDEKFKFKNSKLFIILSISQLLEK